MTLAYCGPPCTIVTVAVTLAHTVTCDVQDSTGLEMVLGTLTEEPIPGSPDIGNESKSEELDCWAGGWFTAEFCSSDVGMAYVAD